MGPGVFIIYHSGNEIYCLLVATVIAGCPHSKNRIARKVIVRNLCLAKSMDHQFYVTFCVPPRVYLKEDNFLVLHEGGQL